EGDARDRDDASECLAQALQSDLSHRPQPFVAPDSSPRTRKRCRKNARSIVGSAARMEPAAMMPYDCSRTLYRPAIAGWISMELVRELSTTAKRKSFQATMNAKSP